MSSFLKIINKSKITLRFVSTNNNVSKLMLILKNIFEHYMLAVVFSIQTN